MAMERIIAYFLEDFDFPTSTRTRREKWEN